MHPVLCAGQEGDQWAKRWNAQHGADKIGLPIPSDILKTDTELDGYLKAFQDDLDSFFKRVPKGGYECQDLRWTISLMLRDAAREKQVARTPGQRMTSSNCQEHDGNCTQSYGMRCLKVETHRTYGNLRECLSLISRKGG